MHSTKSIYSKLDILSPVGDLKSPNGIFTQLGIGESFTSSVALNYISQSLIGYISQILYSYPQGIIYPFGELFF